MHPSAVVVNRTFAECCPGRQRTEVTAAASAFCRQLSERMKVAELVAYTFTVPSEQPDAMWESSLFQRTQNFSPAPSFTVNSSCSDKEESILLIKQLLGLVEAPAQPIVFCLHNVNWNLCYDFADVRGLCV